MKIIFLIACFLSSANADQSIVIENIFKLNGEPALIVSNITETSDFDVKMIGAKKFEKSSVFETGILIFFPFANNRNDFSEKLDSVTLSNFKENVIVMSNLTNIVYVSATVCKDGQITSLKFREASSLTIVFDK